MPKNPIRHIYALYKQKDHLNDYKVSLKNQNFADYLSTMDLFPLNRCGRFGTDVVNDSINAFYFIYYII